ncbi:hypothetical protein SVAN01_09454 [Stagonosporopsis vannaccii]|nr:hypothetical protein SVAN01_09454 [Stagonosporopsis vannaccii]
MHNSFQLRPASVKPASLSLTASFVSVDPQVGGHNTILGCESYPPCLNLSPHLFEWPRLLIDDHKERTGPPHPPTSEPFSGALRVVEPLIPFVVKHATRPHPQQDEVGVIEAAWLDLNERRAADSVAVFWAANFTLMPGAYDPTLLLKVTAASGVMILLYQAGATSDTITKAQTAIPASSSFVFRLSQVKATAVTKYHPCAASSRNVPSNTQLISIFIFTSPLSSQSLPAR